MNKTKTYVAAALCMAIAFGMSSCKSNESLYKKAYEKAQAANQGTQQVTEDPATINVTPVQQESTTTTTTVVTPSRTTTDTTQIMEHRKCDHNSTRSRRFPSSCDFISNRRYYSWKPAKVSGRRTIDEYC